LEVTVAVGPGVFDGVVVGTDVAVSVGFSVAGIGVGGSVGSNAFVTVATVVSGDAMVWGDSVFEEQEIKKNKIPIKSV